MGVGTSDKTAVLLQATDEGSQEHWTWRVGDRPELCLPRKTTLTDESDMGAEDEAGAKGDSEIG